MGIHPCGPRAWPGRPRARASDPAAPDADAADDPAVPRRPAAGAADGSGPDAPLAPERWAAAQSSFVDPRGSVAAAADLVAEAVGALMERVRERERSLRGEWDRDGVHTEGLRHVLQNYRDFLQHISLGPAA